MLKVGRGLSKRRKGSLQPMELLRELTPVQSRIHDVGSFPRFAWRRGAFRALVGVRGSEC
jgi:hypothetical protein